MSDPWLKRVSFEVRKRSTSYETIESITGVPFLHRDKDVEFPSDL